MMKDFRFSLRLHSEFALEFVLEKKKMLLPSFTPDSNFISLICTSGFFLAAAVMRIMMITFEYPKRINMVLGTVYDSLTAKEQHPIAQPNLNNVQSIRSSISNLLFAQHSDDEETGHAGIVETPSG